MEDDMWVMRESDKEEWKFKIESFMTMARLREGFVAINGEWIHSAEFVPPLRPFLIWGANMVREAWREEAQVGWDYIKDYLRSKE
ncbi:hypothetical protein SUGI_0274030 [Cryptomeria japonica]|nr:hypothetical protein SUGI_0274030 [Cryptomeria japonica]